MKTHRFVGILVILFVLAGPLGYLYFKLSGKTATLGVFPENAIVAQWDVFFEQTSGIRPAAPISYRGVTIGEVASVSYDEERDLGKVRIHLWSDVPANIDIIMTQDTPLSPPSLSAELRREYAVKLPNAKSGRVVGADGAEIGTATITSEADVLIRTRNQTPHSAMRFASWDAAASAVRVTRLETDGAQRLTPVAGKRSTIRISQWAATRSNGVDAPGISGWQRPLIETIAPGTSAFLENWTETSAGITATIDQFSAEWLAESGTGRVQIQNTLASANDALDELRRSAKSATESLGNKLDSLKIDDKLRNIDSAVTTFKKQIAGLDGTLKSFSNTATSFKGVAEGIDKYGFVRGMNGFEDNRAKDSARQPVPTQRPPNDGRRR